MTYDWLLLLYGLTFLAALCNTPTWWMLTYQAIRDHIRRRYLLARLAILLFNLGILVGVWVRASEVATMGATKLKPISLIVGITRSLHYVFWGNHPAIFVALSTTLLFIGEVMMLFAGAIAVKEAGGRPLAWRIYCFIAAVWLTIHLGTPL